MVLTSTSSLVICLSERQTLAIEELYICFLGEKLGFWIRFKLAVTIGVCVITLDVVNELSSTVRTWSEKLPNEGASSYNTRCS